MVAIAEEERLMPHFHLSAQSGDDMILKRMKRRHLRAAHHSNSAKRCAALRPDAAFGADLIAGFPTETEEMFENTLKLVDEAGLIDAARLSVQPAQGHACRAHAATAASRRQGTRWRVCAPEARRRWRKDWHPWLAREQDLLIEKPGLGRTRCFAPVHVAGDGAPGSVMQVRIASAGRDHLTAGIA